MARVGAGLVCLTLAGCIGAEALFAPGFLNALGIQSRAASLPGDAPALLIEVENRTSQVVEAQVSWRVKDTEVQFDSFAIPADRKTTEVLICPVDEVTLGDVGDLTRPGAFIRLGDGGPNDPFIEVEAFGVLLKDGANFNCGDIVTFTIQRSSQTLSGYQVFAFIRRAEAP